MSKNEPSLLSSKSSYPQKDKIRRYLSLEFDLVLKPVTDVSKVTVAVSKKVARRAVDRNRIKRIIKEAARALAVNDNSMTFIIKKNIAGLKAYQFAEKLKNLLSK